MWFVITWIALTLGNSVYHWYRIEKLKKWPNHGLWTMYRFIALDICAMLFPGEWVELFVAGALMFPFIFNYRLNLFRKKPFMYLSDHGIDGLLMKITPARFWWFWVYSWMFMLGLKIALSV